MRDLREARGFLLDMDGTVYLGDSLLPGAADFLELCRRRGLPYLFLTNNSSKSARDYAEKLRGMGVGAEPRDILTSGEAAIAYMDGAGYGKDLLLTGTPALEEDFERAGYNIRPLRPRAAVLGFDTGITYEKLTRLCDAVRAGLPYIATHADLVCPVQGGVLPDIGAVIAFVRAAAGRLPDVIVGKPGPLMAEAAVRRIGVPAKALCMAGDRLYTDIAMGGCGVLTALVLSGETGRADLAGSEFKPDFVFENLAGLAGMVRGINEWDC